MGHMAAQTQTDCIGTVSVEQAEQLSRITVENIKAKITDGGVPTLREAQLLAAAKIDPLTIAREAVPMLSAERIAALYPRARLNGRTIMRFLDQAGVPAVKGEGYDVRAATEAIITHYREASEKAKGAREADIDRARAADAETAELRAAQMRGTLANKDDVVSMMADYFARSRVAIETADFLTDPQRKRLFAKLNAIKLSEGGDEE